MQTSHGSSDGTDTNRNSEKGVLSLQEVATGVDGGHGGGMGGL